MMRSMPSDESAPSWFASAIATRPEHRSIEVEGLRIAYRVWGDESLPGLVLVHGGAAHSGWWDHVAPLLTSHRVVAPDLSGHGDSDRRSEPYDVAVWAREVMGVAAAEGLVKPVVVGHSMGGWVAVSCGSQFGDQVSAVAVLDSPLHDQPPEEVGLRERQRPLTPAEIGLRERQRPTRIYPTLEDAVARFVTLPPQELVLPYVKAHIAPQSIHRVEGGWTWKFDPMFFGRRVLLRDALPKLGCPAALFRSEHGLVTKEMAEEMASLVGDNFAVVDVPAAGHHPMLDQPLSLVTGLRTLLALWPRV
jgi:pimeloyl-ACP methyl ester carboxylesterase